MAAYRASLMALRDDPTNSTLRQRTLELGRAYAHLTRNREGVAIFDEVALMNDITAAVGAASLISGMRNLPPSPLQAASIEERLSRLATLRDQGLITAEEYASRRAAMLSEL